MSNHTVTARYLSDFLNQHMEMAQHMDMKVQHYNGDCLALSIALKPSLNDKLTAWGGSLYGLCVMAGWGMYYLKCREQGINPNIVVSHGEIDYLAPVADELIVALCHGQAIDWSSVFARVRSHGKATVALTATVNSAGSTAVTFKGRYTLVGIKK
ncbi:thioesterase domain-containing protein [Dasania sp. GY-MA-18]|uniref:Thioesterase domain-containing protein n=1 Tax=Dasania phycosphaerae TaxID=2950436 RepID=A0A9J6RMU7_9GAMM|nr:MULTISPECIES: thioesterase domain-containing protein [Dasania]MCR8923372.1 thioesterase domain-containing protein [Dasania sp. GY-MA-18]MCZ0865804.1 thioesterase domain-containing protein [Dasania phycosphaerae]MCZ0869529.1 thioesterase domain-containing protein [Dasania phycosphaerae]